MANITIADDVASQPQLSEDQNQDSDDAAKTKRMTLTTATLVTTSPTTTIAMKPSMTNTTTATGTRATMTMKKRTTPCYNTDALTMMMELLTTATTTPMATEEPPIRISTSSLNVTTGRRQHTHLQPVQPCNSHVTARPHIHKQFNNKLTTHKLHATHARFQPAHHRH